MRSTLSGSLYVPINRDPTIWDLYQGPLIFVNPHWSQVGLEKTTRFYQASTSELYGMVQDLWCWKSKAK